MSSTSSAAAIKDGDNWLEAQKLIYDRVSTWVEPSDVQLGDDGEAEESVDDWKTFRESWSTGDEEEKRNNGAKGLNAKKMFQVGLDYNNWTDEDAWGWKTEDYSNDWKDSWSQARAQAKESEEKWGPQGWFNAGYNWVDESVAGDDDEMVEEENALPVSDYPVLGAEEEEADMEDEEDKHLMRDRKH